VAGESASLATRARLRRSVAHAAECAIEAVQLCYRAAGGTAIYESAPFERALRDVNAAATHITTRKVCFFYKTDMAMADVGSGKLREALAGVVARSDYLPPDIPNPGTCEW
jgi:hypothetical protein